jgi:penicillin amidase
MNKAKNHNNYLAALDHWTSPGQNFVFASVKGDIAMRIQGKYPVRRKNEGRFILDGTRTTSEWQAFIPNEHNVQYKNPERGFVSSANQYPVDLTYPYYINATSYEAYRNRRINQRLSELANITPQDMMDLQLDNYSIKAQEILPRLLQLTDSISYSETETKVRAILRSWDFQNNPKLEAPAYFDRWWRILYSGIWDEFLKSEMALPSPTAFNTIKLIKETPPDFPYFDRVDTPEEETLTELVIASFKQAVADIENWKSEKNTSLEWAKYRDTYVEHLLRQEPLSVHAPNGGNSESVNASTRRHGPSWRMVVSLEKSGVKAWGVYPGGQSGNPGSQFYDNLVDEWRDGKYFQLHFSKSRDSYSSSKSIITLNPAN